MLEPTVGTGGSWRRILKLALFLALLVLILGATYEVRTSAIQSWLFHRLASELTYTVAAGPSGSIVFPKTGPFNERRGYSLLSGFQQRLHERGYRTAEQARFSPRLVELANRDLVPPYREPAVTGLVVRGAGGAELYSAVPAERTFESYQEVPPLLVRALLYIENRELDRPANPRKNPVVEWDRLARAGVLYALRSLGFRVQVEGASTLATQIEKYRYSKGGRTGAASDKLRQMISASLKAYRAGPDTTEERRHIVLEYLNSMPLGAARGYGELYGLGDGLYAWFGANLRDVCALLADPRLGAAKARAFKQALAMVVAVRAPSYYLSEDRPALEARVSRYVELLVETGVIDSEFARLLRGTSLDFLPRAPVPPPFSYPERKAANAVRSYLMGLLGVPGFYELDRLHLEVESTIDVSLQHQVAKLFQELQDPGFVAVHGLLEDRLLLKGDPREVDYSLVLFEKAEGGDVLRVLADSLDRPFDLNAGMKLELGSTAKLRTLAHYLELVGRLWEEISDLDADALLAGVQQASDPITGWVAQSVLQERGVSLDELLASALNRTYSASPRERFFTGGGLHSFSNFSPEENSRIMTVNEALRRSTNLVFVRLMRDLVRYHQARLPYDAKAVLAQLDHPERKQFLEKIAEEESQKFLSRAYRDFRKLPEKEILSKLLKNHTGSPRHEALVFYAWDQQGGEDGLNRWLQKRAGSLSQEQVQRLAREYGKPHFGLADYGYLLKIDPVELWCAGQLAQQPDLGWDELVERSKGIRRAAYAWLFNTRNRRAQDLRLRAWIERDAFRRMTPEWQQLGFSFEELVPSLATAIGSSSDRPVALADLMSIIVNDGVRRQRIRLRRLTFARGTPYQSVFEIVRPPGEQVLPAAVSKALREALAGVVEAGTARRVAGAFRRADGTPVPAGGKTGSGDNRYQSIGSRGQVVSSRAVSRTATFVFYIGDRYYGVIAAFVEGPKADNYNFTSGLPVTILKMLAPAINSRL